MVDSTEGSAESAGPARVGVPLAIVLVIFFLSGATGLVYEVVWTRMLTLVFGHTIYAVSTVLTAFMAGLALGSWLSGRLADRLRRPLRSYALLELAIGLYALLIPLLLGRLDFVFRPIYSHVHGSFYLFSMIRFAACFLVLVLPTTLMGATLPLLSRIVAPAAGTLGKRLGALYSVNTLGAVLGCAATGFVLIRVLGVRETIAAAAGLNVLIAAAAWLVSARPIAAELIQEESSRDPQEAPSALSLGRRRAVLVAFFVSGFVALALEVLWTRSLVYTFFQGSSTYAFTTILTLFLAGLGFGALVAAPFADRARNPLRWLAAGELVIGVFAIVSLPLLVHLARAHAGQLPTYSWLSLTLRDFLKSAIVMAAPTFAMGAIFPLIVRAYIADAADAARGIGTLYAFNTAGAIGGSFLAGFVLIPFVGMSTSLIVLGSVSVVIAIGLVAIDPGTTRAVKLATAGACGAGLIVLVAVLPAKAAFQQVLDGERLLFYREGETATVAVVQLQSGERQLNIDNVGVAGSNIEMLTDQKSLAHVPGVLHPHPRRVLTVGFGSGGTSWSFTTYRDLEAIRCVEIAPTVVAAHTQFPDCNFDLFKDPRYKVIFEDARSLLRLDDSKYDVISTDCTDLQYKSNADLYTVEYFEQCRRRLNDDGIFVVWMPLSGLTDTNFRVVLSTFVHVYPEGTVWYLNNYPTHYLLLVGCVRPLTIDWPRLEERISQPDVKRDLALIDLADPYKLASGFLMDAPTLRRFVAGYAPNTEDRPVLEYDVARNLAGDVTGNLETLIRAADSVRPPVVGIPAERTAEVRAGLDAHLAARRHVLRGHLDFRRGREDFARYEYEKALAITPSDVSLMALLGVDDRTRDRLLARIAADPKDLKARYDLAFLYRGRGDFARARALLSEILAADPHYPLAAVNLGLTYERENRFDDAAEAYRGVLVSNPNQDARAIAEGMLKLNEMKRTIRATADPAAEATALNALADRYAGLGDPIEGVRVIEEYAARRETPEVLGVLVERCLALGLTDDAAEACQRWLRLRPEAPEPHYYLLKAYYNGGLLDRAAEEFAAARAAASEEPAIWYLGARVFARLGKTDEAAEALGKALSLGGRPMLELAIADPVMVGSPALRKVLAMPSGGSAP